MPSRCLFLWIMTDVFRFTLPAWSLLSLLYFHIHICFLKGSAHLWSGDGERRVGQLFVLRLFSSQTSCIFHLLKLFWELFKDVKWQTVSGNETLKKKNAPLLALALFTWCSCCSVANPRPYTVLALLSAHCPNFWEVLVNVMLGVTVQLMIACTYRDSKDDSGVSTSCEQNSKFSSNTTAVAQV